MMRTTVLVLALVALACFAGSALAQPGCEQGCPLNQACSININCFFGTCNGDWCECFSAGNWGGCNCLVPWGGAPPATQARCSPSFVPPVAPPPVAPPPIAPPPTAPVVPTAPVDPIMLAPQFPVPLAPTSVSCDCPSGQVLYGISDNGRGVFRINPDNTKTLCSRGVAGRNYVHAREIESDANGNLYVVDDGAHTIQRIAAGCGANTMVLSQGQLGIARPWDIKILVDGSMLITDVATHVIWRVNLNAAGQIVGGAQLWASGGYTSIACDPATGTVFAVENNAIVVAFLNGNPASRTVLFTNQQLFIVDLADIVFRLACGSLFIAADDNNQAFVCTDPYNPNTCSNLCQVYSDSSTCDGLMNPVDVALDCECDLYVSNAAAARIVKYTNGVPSVYYQGMIVTGITFVQTQVFTTCTSMFVPGTIPPNQIIPRNDMCSFNSNPAVTGGFPQVTDNCDGTTTLVYWDDLSNIDPVAQDGFIIRHWRAQHACGPPITATTRIDVIDFNPPNNQFPGDINITCVEFDNGAANPNTGSTGRPSVDPNPCAGCSTVATNADTILPGSCPDNFVIRRVWTLTDSCTGATATSTQHIYVNDNNVPTWLVFPSNLHTTIECDDCPGGGFPPSCTGQPTCSDPCGTTTVTFTDVNNPAGCPQTGVITRTWRCADQCGNSITGIQTITYFDGTPPSIVAPPDVTAQCPVGPVNLGQPTVSDNCDGTPTVTNTPGGLVPTCGTVGTVTVTWTATDDCSNSASDTQLVTYIDTVPPTITLAQPGPITLQCSDDLSPAGPAGGATATDACDNNVVPTFVDGPQTPGACPDAYSFVRTWTAVDDCSNSATATQLIIVTDTTGPVVTPPADATVSCDAAPAAFLPANTGTATATDNCDPNPSLTFSDGPAQPGSCPQNSFIIRTWTATDRCGQTGSAQQRINIVDSTAPVINAQPDTTVECPSDVDGVPKADANDNCAGLLTVGSGVTFVDTVISGTPPATPYVIQRTYTATDPCSNSATDIQLITVLDITPPTLTPRPPMGPLCCPVSTDVCNVGDVVGTDRCGNTTTTFVDSFSNDPNCPTAPFETQTITRTWTSCDPSNNCDTLVQVFVRTTTLTCIQNCP